MVEPRTLLVLDASADQLRDLEAAATRLGDLRVVASGPAKARPDAVLLALADVGSADFERLRAVIRRTGAPVVVTAPDADSLALRQLFRTGARDVLLGPQDPASLTAALGELFASPDEAQRSRGAIISVLKGCGGAGATTVALNLAALSAAGEGHRPATSSAVLDLDLQFGDTDVALDLQPRTGLVDLLRSEATLDGRLLDSVLTEHGTGLRLLAPAPALTPLDALPTELALAVVELAAAQFDRVVVDLPPAWADWTLPLLARSDVLVLTTAATVTGVLGARRVLDTLDRAGVSTPRLLVLNRVAGVLELLDRPGRVQRALSCPVDATLPFDPKLVRAAEGGRLVVEASRRSPAARALGALHRRIEAELGAASPAPVRLEAAE